MAGTLKKVEAKLIVFVMGFPKWSYIDFLPFFYVDSSKFPVYIFYFVGKNIVRKKMKKKKNVYIYIYIYNIGKVEKGTFMFGSYRTQKAENPHEMQINTRRRRRDAIKSVMSKQKLMRHRRSASVGFVGGKQLIT